MRVSLVHLSTDPGQPGNQVSVNTTVNGDGELAAKGLVYRRAILQELAPKFISVS
jgi:hypothetical protein